MSARVAPLPLCPIAVFVYQADQPARRIVCGMMRAVDSSLKNVTDAYVCSGVGEGCAMLRACTCLCARVRVP